MTGGMLNIAILGSGKIGIDLLCKVIKSKYLTCKLVAGRNLKSEGLVFAKKKGFDVSDKGIDSIIKIKDNIDLVFDATSAADHIGHWEILKKNNINVIDMTPSNIGHPIIPTINLDHALVNKNINMVSCGGQSSIPLIHTVKKILGNNVKYIELVSSIASISAGPATRINIDEYITNTALAIKKFSANKINKVILILNPAEPPIYMQTTLSFLLQDDSINLKYLTRNLYSTIYRVKEYLPGYRLAFDPKIIEKRLVIMIKVIGNGDYLPEFSGNLDIINAAAIKVAEHISKNKI
jgi:acetaldehyde dehydrogenase (acetylating)